MPVDHPDAAPSAVRRTVSRKLIVALSFLVTLGTLLAIAPLIDLGSQLP